MLGLTLSGGSHWGMGDGTGDVVPTRRGDAICSGTEVGGMAGGWQMLVRRATKSRRAWVWVSISGARGERGDGCCSAMAMLCRLVMMVFVVELAGIWTLDGNQVSLSQMRTALVSQIHI